MRREGRLFTSSTTNITRSSFRIVARQATRARGRASRRAISLHLGEKCTQSSPASGPFRASATKVAHFGDGWASNLTAGQAVGPLQAEADLAENLIENVSDTAFWVAHYRALETQRSDALFHDPLASLLAGDRRKNIAKAMPMPFVTGWVVVVRTCIIDRYIQWALAQGVDAILNLGAGLDTRPYRMDLQNSLLWIEADYPHMIEFKQARLSNERPRCHLERVSLDLAGNLTERRNLFGTVDARAKKFWFLPRAWFPT